MATISRVIHILASHWRPWLMLTVGMTALFYALQMLALVVRFGDWPNYITVFDWWGNVVRIIDSTPSMSDTLTIIKDEWWVEIGYMNRDFGLGISEWSLYIAPFKALVVMGVFSVVAANWVLLKQSRAYCQRSLKTGAQLANGLGASLLAVTSITMSWVVCCATPTWIVGLAMLGLGVTTSLQLEPLGHWLAWLGVVLLVLAIYLQARAIEKNQNFQVAGRGLGN